MVHRSVNWTYRCFIFYISKCRCCLITRCQLFILLFNWKSKFICYYTVNPIGFVNDCLRLSFRQLNSCDVRFGSNGFVYCAFVFNCLHGRGSWCFTVLFIPIVVYNFYVDFSFIGQFNFIVCWLRRSRLSVVFTN